MSHTKAYRIIDLGPHKVNTTFEAESDYTIHRELSKHLTGQGWVVEETENPKMLKVSIGKAVLGYIEEQPQTKEAITAKECCNCGDCIEGDYYEEKDNDIYCDSCYRRLYQFDCPICENWHDNQKTPETTFFYLHVPTGGLKPGYYKVKGYPVWVSDMFDVMIQEYNVERVSENLCYKYDGPMQITDYICEECFKDAGLDAHNVERHIRYEMNQAYRPRKHKNFKSVTVFVSPEYFTVCKGKVKIKKVRIKENKLLQPQEIMVEFNTTALANARIK